MGIEKTLPKKKKIGSFSLSKAAGIWKWIGFES
jgi:hypothetical protein